MKRHVAPHLCARVRQGGVRGAMRPGRGVLFSLLQVAQQQVAGTAFRQTDSGLRAALVAQVAFLPRMRVLSRWG